MATPQQPNKHIFQIEFEHEVSMAYGKDIDPVTGEEKNGDPPKVCGLSKAMSPKLPDPTTLEVHSKHSGSISMRWYYYRADGSYLGWGDSRTVPERFKGEVGSVRVSIKRTDDVPIATLPNIKVTEMREVRPYYKSLVRKWSKEKDQQFFRETLEGDMLLRGADYDLVKTNFQLGEKIPICVYSSAGVSRSKVYKGYFRKIDCEFNHAQKSIKLKITPEDSYTEVLARMDDKFDLPVLAPPITPIGAYKRPVEQIYVAGADSVTNFQGGTYWEYPVKERITDSEALQNTYHFSHTDVFGEITLIDYRLVSAGVKSTHMSSDTGGSYKVFDSYLKILQRPDWKLVYLSLEINGVTYISEDLLVGIHVISYLGKTFLHPGLEIPLFMDWDSNKQKKFTVQSIATYNIYRRRLADVGKGKNQTELFALDRNDFAANTAIYSYCMPSNSESGFVKASTRAVDEPTRYGKNDYGKYFSNNIESVSAGHNPYRPVCRNSWANVAVWFSYSYEQFRYYDRNYTKEYRIKDTYSIADVIKVLLKKIDPSLKHEANADYSAFLYSSPGMRPLAFDDFEVFITQKTNILKGEYDQAAQKAEITLKQVLDMLRKCFQCYWFIEQGMFRIEHIDFFNWGGTYDYNKVIQFDAQKWVDNFNGQPILYQQNTVEYDKSRLKSGYSFDYMEEAGASFSGMRFSQRDEYLKDAKPEDVKVDNFSADIDMMLFDPEKFSNDGFALLCPVYEKGVHSKSDRYLPVHTLRANDNRDGYPREIEVDVQNTFASWLYLMRMYMFDLSGRNTAFESDFIDSSLRLRGNRRFMTGSVRFKADRALATSLNTTGLIRTDAGEGQIEEMTRDLETRVLDMKLLYHAE